MNRQTAIGRQDQIEARARQLQGVALEGCTDLKAIYGSATEWVMVAGPFRFFLIPFLGEWWFYDEVHGEWRFTGKRIGEVHFAYDGTTLRFDAPVAPAIDDPPPASAPAHVRRFCTACGERIEPAWKFCQSCGAKLAG